MGEDVGEQQCRRLAEAILGRLPSAKYDAEQVLGGEAWRRIADAVDELAYLDPADFCWSPGHLGRDGRGGDRRWMLRRLTTLPGLRELTDVRQLAEQLSGALGTATWDPTTVGGVLVGWPSEVSLPSLQALGRALGRGASIEESADTAGVDVKRAQEVHRFLGLSQLRAQQDLHLALKALDEGWTKAECRRVTGWGNGKWSRMMEAARAHRAEQPADDEEDDAEVALAEVFDMEAVRA